MTVELQVLSGGSTPTFVIFPAKQATTITPQALVELKKQLLPIQLPLQSVMQHLLRLATYDEQPDGSVGELLQRLARAVLRELPAKTAMTEPTQLKSQVDNSGLFLESKLLALLKQPSLATELPLLQQDMKFKLGKLAESIQQLLTGVEPEREQQPQPVDLELLKDSLNKTQGALAKQTLDQLNSLPKDDVSRQSWIIELPFRNPPEVDSILLEIEQDRGKSSESKQNYWAVSITISPPDLGTIHCKLSCYDGSVNSRFWSESAETVEKINTHLDYLKQQFELKGLSAGFMEAQQGKPTNNDNPKPPSATLLSIKV